MTIGCGSDGSVDLTTCPKRSRNAWGLTPIVRAKDGNVAHARANRRRADDAIYAWRRPAAAQDGHHTSRIRRG
jgi:hypothetical protein